MNVSEDMLELPILDKDYPYEMAGLFHVSSRVLCNEM